MIRNIGALLVRGFKPRDVLTQHMARYTSPTQGKDGTSHFGDLKVRRVVSPPLDDYFLPNTAKVVAPARELAHY